MEILNSLERGNHNSLNGESVGEGLVHPYASGPPPPFRYHRQESPW